MKRLAFLLALLPFAAMADETVELTDGRRLVLRDNKTYEVLPKLTTGIVIHRAFYTLGDDDRCDAKKNVTTVCGGKKKCSISSIDGTLCDEKSKKDGGYLTIYHTCGNSNGTTWNREKVELECKE